MIGGGNSRELACLRERSRVDEAPPNLEACCYDLNPEYHLGIITRRWEVGV